MKWTTKALIQRILSRTPGGKLVYFYAGQRLFGGFRRFRVDERVREASTLLECFYEIGENIEGRSAVEIGTGWVPVAPLFYWLYGQKQCFTFDISPLLKNALVVEAARQLSERLSASPTFSNTLNVFVERQSQLRKLVEAHATAREILQHCQITYLAPVAESNTGIPDESVDIVYSSTVLEHVPLAELAVLMGEARRVLRPGGFMFHLINPADHFAYSDRSISTINFLQFSESEFAKYNSDFIFQNRLRPFQYRQFILEHGFEIVYWKVLTQPSTLEQLPRKYLHKDFAALADEELSAHDIYVVARRLQ